MSGPPTSTVYVSELEPARVIRPPDLSVSRRFWTSIAPWFAEHGYTLYVFDGPGDRIKPKIRPEVVQSDNVAFPYAHFGDWNVASGPFSINLSPWTGSIFFAQDSQSNHVAIKLVKDNTDEIRILKMLQGEAEIYDERTCPSVLPILEILPFKDYHFVIMPRWGSSPHVPHFRQMYELYAYIHCMLRAVEFLHQRKVVHRDIALRNIVMNQYGTEQPTNSVMRAELRSQERVIYALIDFDISIMFPRNATPADCRLRYKEACYGDRNTLTHDVSHGEYDYDPFALDIGMLGVTFCYLFQHHTVDIPILAPFLDRMVTRDVPKRFTATEARKFFEEQVIPLSTPEQLLSQFQYLGGADRTHFNVFDRWKGLPPAFVEEWSGYREPPEPTKLKVLRRLCQSKPMHLVVVGLRRLFAPVSSALRRA